MPGFAQLPALKAGDIVEVDGNATYAPVIIKDSGTAAAKITIRGIRVAGKRPVLSGGVNTLDIAGSHVTIEGFDITGGTSRCVFHRANDVTIRDTVIHDCPAHGLLGADNGSGSLLLEYVEVHHCGAGDSRHQIYMATDEVMYPGSVFRMQYCYLHDGNGGHGVKSRAERNEIYYNWIEGSYYHELELIGPDPAGDTPEDKAREDSDVVGNVIRKTGTRPGGHVVRLGGDGTGQSIGRYRFVNNTFLMGQGLGVAFRIFDRVDSLEAHNNVFFKVGGGTIEAIRTTEAALPLPLISGSNNWLPTGSALPASWIGTLTGADPAFAAMSTKNLHPVSASPLVDRGGAMPFVEPAGKPFPSPLAAPLFEPPAGFLMNVGTALARTRSNAIDLGAYEMGGAVATPPPATTMPPATTTPPPVTTTPAPGTTNPGTTNPGTTNPGTTMPGTTTPAPGTTPSAGVTPGAMTGTTPGAMTGNTGSMGLPGADTTPSTGSGTNEQDAATPSAGCQMAHTGSSALGVAMAVAGLTLLLLRRRLVPARARRRRP